MHNWSKYEGIFEIHRLTEPSVARDATAPETALQRVQYLVAAYQAPAREAMKFIFRSETMTTAIAY